MPPLRFSSRFCVSKLASHRRPRSSAASARQGLAARRNQDAAAWQHSGMAEIEQQIVEFLLTEKTEVLQKAVSRQTSDVLADVQRREQLTLRSLQMPLADLDGRIRLFEESLTRIDEQRIVLMDRLGREEERLAKSVKKHADQLLPQSYRFFRGVVQSCQDRDGEIGPKNRPARPLRTLCPVSSSVNSARHTSFVSRSCEKPCCPIAAEQTK